MQNIFGIVYAVLISNYNGKCRIKVGYTTDKRSRFSTYRSIVPDIIYLAGHVVPRDKEQDVIKSLAKEFTKIGAELFEIKEDEINNFALTFTNSVTECRRALQFNNFYELTKCLDSGKKLTWGNHRPHSNCSEQCYFKQRGIK